VLVRAPLAVHDGQVVEVRPRESGRSPAEQATRNPLKGIDFGHDRPKNVLPGLGDHPEGLEDAVGKPDR
jgi:hypothetical protein